MKLVKLECEAAFTQQGALYIRLSHIGSDDEECDFWNWASVCKREGEGGVISSNVRRGCFDKRSALAVTSSRYLYAPGQTFGYTHVYTKFLSIKVAGYDARVTCVALCVLCGEGKNKTHHQNTHLCALVYNIFYSSVCKINERRSCGGTSATRGCDKCVH